jgi:hypothetical protein
VETQDKDVILEGLSTVSSLDEWTPLSISGHRPKPRYEVRQMPQFPLSSFNTYVFFSNYFYSTNKNFGCCSMERLYYKIRCIYLVETITGVTLVTFRYMQLNTTTYKAIPMHPKLSAMDFKNDVYCVYCFTAFDQIILKYFILFNTLWIHCTFLLMVPNLDLL